MKTSPQWNASFSVDAVNLSFRDHGFNELLGISPKILGDSRTIYTKHEFPTLPPRASSSGKEVLRPYYDFAHHTVRGNEQATSLCAS